MFRPGNFLRISVFKADGYSSRLIQIRSKFSTIKKAMSSDHKYTKFMLQNKHLEKFTIKQGNLKLHFLYI